MGWGTISDWIKEGSKRGLVGLASDYHSDKLEDYARLKESGLPMFDDIIIPLIRFNQKNKKLLDFLSKYTGFVVRAIPKTSKLQRRYKIGVNSFDDCIEFLDDVVEEDSENLYSVFLTEWGPQEGSGIVICDGEFANVEVSLEENLDKLSHGEVIPGGGKFVISGFNHFRGLNYYNTTDEHKRLMYAALICLTRSNLISMKGYFEFVITNKGEIKFLDYKVNEMYLK